MATQEELRQHLRKLGWSEEKTSQLGDEEISQEVILISKRPLTKAEEKYAKTLKSTL